MTVTVTALSSCDHYPFVDSEGQLCPNTIGEQSALALALALSFGNETAHCIIKIQYIESFEHLIDKTEKRE